MTTKRIALAPFPGAVGTAQTTTAPQSVDIATYTMKDGATYTLQCVANMSATSAGVLYSGLYTIIAVATKKAGANGTFTVGSAGLVANGAGALAGTSVQLLLTGANLEIITLRTVGKVALTIDHFAYISGTEYIP